jgi:hypothetical protein
MAALTTAVRGPIVTSRKMPLILAIFEQLHHGTLLRETTAGLPEVRTKMSESNLLSCRWRRDMSHVIPRETRRELVG